MSQYLNWSPACPGCGKQHYRKSDYCTKCDPVLYEKCVCCGGRFRKMKTKSFDSCYVCRPRPVKVSHDNQGMEVIYE